ncbi:uncharacterized protein METZ01_LOCUS473773, partial [marine metagenome]
MGFHPNLPEVSLKIVMYKSKFHRHRELMGHLKYPVI